MNVRSFPKKQLAYAGLVGAAVVSAACNIPAAVASATSGPHALATGGFSASVAGYVLGANNTYSTNAFSAYGVEGIASNDVGGVGTLGYALASKSYGTYGVSFGTNGIGVYGAGDGPTPGPMSTPNAGSESTGVVGDSHSGFGVYGSTEFPGVADDMTNPIGGVVGVDSANDNEYNAGVVGMTSNGAYGVEGVSGSGSIGGVFGYGTNGHGVDGQSSSSTGGYFTSATGTGAYGSTLGTATGVAGVTGYGDAAGAYGIYGINGSNGPGVYSTSATGDAYYGTTGGGITYHGVNTNGNGSDIQGSYIGLLGRAPAGTSAYPLALTDTSSNIVFYIDGSGDYYYHGTAHTFAKTRSGMTATSYGPKTSEPTIEDTGSARLVGGLAQVRLDPALVEQMDMSTKYRVFVTPDGDTKGLFVASKTPQGFIVRENQGGRSSVDFDYRIVATVDGQANKRMSLFRSDAEAGTAMHMPVAPIRTMAHPPAGRLALAAMAAKKSNRGSGAAGTALHIFVPQKNLAVESRYVPARTR